MEAPGQGDSIGVLHADKGTMMLEAVEKQTTFTKVGSTKFAPIKLAGL